MHNLSEKLQYTCDEGKLGRHLIANVDIEVGEMLLEERPLLIAAHWDCEQMKCANCHCASFVMCKKCQVFPLCIDCSIHDEFDCEFFCKNDASKISRNLLVENSSIYAVLKLLLLLENEQTCKDAKLLISKSVELNEYRNTTMWHDHETNIIRPLLDSGLISLLKQHKSTIDGDELHRFCILIDAHALEVTSQDGDALKGVYVSGAQLPHNCVPNAATSLDDECQMRLFAAVPIKSGEIIYNNYTNPLMGTSQRQLHLQMTRHLECECKRCLDPTELGTHMSSLKCQKCSDGYVERKSNLKWSCNKCTAQMDTTEVNRLLAELSDAMTDANGDVHTYETLLTQYSDRLHPNHFLFLDIKQNIATILHAILLNPMCGAGKKVLKRKVQLSEEILPVIHAVLPGISKLYAIALYEYLLALVELNDMQFKDHEITQEAYMLKLKFAKEIAGKAIGLLSYEAENSPEGHLMRRIAMEQQRIEENIEELSQTIK